MRISRTSRRKSRWEKMREKMREQGLSLDEIDDIESTEGDREAYERRDD